MNYVHFYLKSRPPDSIKNDGSNIQVDISYRQPCSPITGTGTGIGVARAEAASPTDTFNFINGQKKSLVMEINRLQQHLHHHSRSPSV